MTEPIAYTRPQPLPTGAQMRKLALRLAPYLTLAVLWQIAASVFPAYLFPSLVDVLARGAHILTTWDDLANVLETVGRILAGLAGAFAIGTALAVLMMRRVGVEHFVSPLL